MKKAEYKIPTIIRGIYGDRRDLTTIAIKMLLTALLVIGLAITLSSCGDAEHTPTSMPAEEPAAGPTRALTPTPFEISPAEQVRLSAPPAGPEVEMVYIPAGEFTMGTTEEQLDTLLAWAAAQGYEWGRDWFEEEQPARVIYLDAYWLDLTEVTNAQFAAFVESTGYATTAEVEGTGYVWTEAMGWEDIEGADWKHPQGPGSDLSGLDEHPVVLVSWDDAVAYCEWRGARLPTEAEWEKAARGPDGLIYPWGDKFDCKKDNLDDETTVDEEVVAGGPDCDGYTFTAPVRNFPDGASPYGVVNMAGNVWEWVSDWYDRQYYGQLSDTNPAGPDSGTARVVRGGSWRNADERIGRAANRFGVQPSYPLGILGFRCVSASP